MRLFDCFPFNNELDMLECRLVQFEDFPVYRHVLAEAAVDYQGHPKPLYYAENKERFAPWADRIIHVVADDLPDMTWAQPWARERTQRDSIAAGLADADMDDRLILADVDEIPNEAGMAAALGPDNAQLEMITCLFAVDWLWGALPTSVVVRAGDAYPVSGARGLLFRPKIPDAGHHLSWLGGQAGIAAKAEAHCHVECNDDIAAVNADDRMYREGVNPFVKVSSGRVVPGAIWLGGDPGAFPQLTPADVDETWPRYVRERRCPANWFRPREETQHDRAGMLQPD